MEQQLFPQDQSAVRSRGTRRSQRAEQQRAPAAPIDAERRHRMIAEAAYYKAKNRGFDGGRGMQDWLLAEQEFEADA